MQNYYLQLGVFCTSAASPSQEDCSLSENVLPLHDLKSIFFFFLPTLRNSFPDLLSADVFLSVASSWWLGQKKEREGKKASKIGHLYSAMLGGVVREYLCLKGPSLHDPKRMSLLLNGALVYISAVSFSESVAPILLSYLGDSPFVQPLLSRPLHTPYSFT